MIFEVVGLMLVTVAGLGFLVGALAGAAYGIGSIFRGEPYREQGAAGLVAAFGLEISLVGCSAMIAYALLHAWSRLYLPMPAAYQ